MDLSTGSKTLDFISIGVLGVGHMGAYHANVLAQTYPNDFIGVYDKNGEKAKKVAARCDVEAFSDLDVLLEKCSAVIVASPTSTHYRYVKKLLDAGKHVLVEKPFTSVYQEAVELCRLAKGKKLNLMVGHVERYNGAVAELPKIIKTPYFWHSKRIGPNTQRIKDTGVCLDLLIHDIDICLRTINSGVKEVSANGIFSGEQGSHEDLASVRIVFDNNCIATFLACRVSHEKERSLHVIDKDFNLLLDYTTQDISIFRDGESQITTENNQIRYRSQSTLERLFIHKENPLKQEIVDFITRSRTGNFFNTEKDLITLKTTLSIVEEIKRKETDIRGKEKF